jgi:hypothetical protein
MFLRLFILLSFILSGCSGTASPEPFTIPVPFAGALSADSRVVVANGNSVGGTSLSLSQKSIISQAQQGCDEFQNFNSDGSFAGSTELCESSGVTSTPFPDNRRDNFTTHAEVNFINKDRAAATVECFDFPYTDPKVVVPPGSELRKGVCSAILQEGDGSFANSVGKTTIIYRYVAITRLENNRKRFDQMLESSWVLNRISGGSTALGPSEGKVLAILVENGFAQLGVNVPIKVPLFCEGQDPHDVANACGALEFTILGGGQFQIGDQLRSINNLNVTVCEGDSCLPTTNAVFVDDFISELDQSLIDALSIPEFDPVVTEAGVGFSLLTGGRADNSVMTQHDPIDCNNPALTGKFRDPGCAGKLKLDYRCMVLVNRNTGESYTFAGTFIISETN